MPPPSHDHISSRGSTGNEEQAESQAVRYVFGNVLHKWHELVLPGGSEIGVFYVVIYAIISNTYWQPGRIVGRPGEPRPQHISRDRSRVNGARVHSAIREKRIRESPSYFALDC